MALFVPAPLGWDAGARRLAGVAAALVGGDCRDALLAVLPLALLPAAVYVASWTGWFLADATPPGTHDQFVRPGQDAFTHALAVLHGWLDYHREIWRLPHHADAGAPLPDRAARAGCCSLARSRTSTPHRRRHLGCNVHTCSREMLAIGTPAIWWAPMPALLWLAWRWVTARDWRAAAILGGSPPATCRGSGRPQHRTMFLFYALPAVPFMALALAHGRRPCARRAAGVAERRRGIGARPAPTRCSWSQLLLPLPRPRRPGDPPERLERPHVVPQCTAADPRHHTVGGSLLDLSPVGRVARRPVVRRDEGRRCRDGLPYS